MAATEASGHEGNFAKASSSGFVKLAATHTRTISTVISADRSTLRQGRMETLTAKLGFSVSTARNGSTLSVKLNTATLSSIN